MLLLAPTIHAAEDGYPDEALLQEFVEEETPNQSQSQSILEPDASMTISVVGQGVAPSFASSPAQSYALAKRAAMADAYRLLAERIKGVKIQGKDTIKNMAIKSSVINTQVSAMIKNAAVVETTFKDGMCEVEMEIEIQHNQF